MGYKVGLIGYGFRQDEQMAALGRIDGIDVRACTGGRDPEKLEAFREKHGIPRSYPDWEAMLNSEKLDLITIVVPPAIREGPVTLAAERGVKGIVCEKPMAINLAEADRMSEACSKAGTVLTINHQLRFMEIMNAAKQAIDDGRIGDVEYYRASSYVKVHGQGTHMVDLVRYWHGDAPLEWLMASVSGTETFDAKIPGPDQGFATLCFADGTPLYLECGTQAPQRPGHPLPNYNCYAEAVGTHGRVWTGINSGLRIWDRDGNYESRPVDYATADIDSQEGFVRELLDSIENGTPHRCSAELARPTHEALLGILLSAETMERVAFPVEWSSSHWESLRRRMA